MTETRNPVFGEKSQRALDLIQAADKILENVPEDYSRERFTQVRFPDELKIDGLNVALHVGIVWGKGKGVYGVSDLTRYVLDILGISYYECLPRPIVPLKLDLSELIRE